MSYFYCYSLKLKDFLKLNSLRFIERKRHANGNLYWVFERNERLDLALKRYDKYKEIFSDRD